MTQTEAATRGVCWISGPQEVIGGWGRWRGRRTGVTDYEILSMKLIVDLTELSTATAAGPD